MSSRQRSRQPKSADGQLQFLLSSGTSLETSTEHRVPDPPANAPQPPDPSTQPPSSQPQMPETATGATGIQVVGLPPAASPEADKTCRPRGALQSAPPQPAETPPTADGVSACILSPPSGSGTQDAQRDRQHRRFTLERLRDAVEWAKRVSQAASESQNATQGRTTGSPPVKSPRGQKRRRAPQPAEAGPRAGGPANRPLGGSAFPRIEKEGDQ